MINRQIKPYPLGAHCEDDKTVRFSFISKSRDCGVILYDRESGRRIKKIPFFSNERIGNIYCKYVEGIEPSRVTYQYFENDKIIPDSRARVFVGRHGYGKERSIKDLKAGFDCNMFDWGDDACPRIPYTDVVAYCMHVRGFTRHNSSGVEHKGTFLGMVEKLDYLKKTGITTVELQPAYEFLEMPDAEERRSFFGNNNISDEDLDIYYPQKLNYWGYKQGYYYAPKSAYAAGPDASSEFKQMVKAFHAAGIEIVMQFYFPNEVDRMEILDILRFWVINYHIDGFHLMGENIPTVTIAKDNALADTKLWYYSFDTNAVYSRNDEPAYKNLAEYNDDYFADTRKFLKGDENMLDSFLAHFRYNPRMTGKINYLTNYYGLTLMDTVSYDRKHNELNGEDNRDGINVNYSWNCGEEGASRKKKILMLRKQQIKNALSMLLLSQASPLIFMGDEFGNSQKGNNNPYCQDNAVTWLDWSGLEKNSDIYAFWSMLIKIRREHPIFHTGREFSFMDPLSCGYPDISFHGQNAWRPQLEGYSRHVGIMLCGKYARECVNQDDNSFYIAFNMHWERKKLALPKAPKGTKWKKIFCTESQNPDFICPDFSEIKEDSGNQEENLDYMLSGRTVAMFAAVNIVEKPIKPKRRTKKA